MRGKMKLNSIFSRIKGLFKTKEEEHIVLPDTLSSLIWVVRNCDLPWLRTGDHPTIYANYYGYVVSVTRINNDLLLISRLLDGGEEKARIKIVPQYVHWEEMLTKFSTDFSKAEQLW